MNGTSSDCSHLLAACIDKFGAIADWPGAGSFADSMLDDIM